MSDRQFTTRRMPAVDPRATDDDLTVSIPAVPISAQPQQPSRYRQVYGRVYELITGDPQDGPHPYVGKTVQTLHQRVHSSRNAHTSPESITKDPWKARILPGRAGYRLIETVYATGDPAEDERTLRRAEAFWIDRLRPTHNQVRPVRPPVHEQAPPKIRPAKRRPALTATARAGRRRMLTFATMAVVATVFFAVQFAQVAWDEPATPWIAAPVCGVGLAWAAYFAARNTVRRIKRKW